MHLPEALPHGPRILVRPVSRRGLLARGSAGGIGAALSLSACDWRPALTAPPKRMPRVGLFAPTSNAAFFQGLRELGYVEGQNIHVELRPFGDLTTEQARTALAELVALRVDVIVTSNIGTAGISPAELVRLAGGVPIVYPVLPFSEVGTDVVKSLARPGGTLTGIVGALPSLDAKRLELLKETLPGAARVAFLQLRPAVRPGDPDGWPETQAAAGALGLQLRLWTAFDLEQFASNVAAASEWAADAVIFASYVTDPSRSWVAELAATHRLPAMYPRPEFVAAGGLMSYGVSRTEPWRRAATYVDKILKGAKPGDLPIELPTKFDLAVNLRTAQALGITFPQSVLIQAPEIIR